MRAMRWASLGWWLGRCRVRRRRGVGAHGGVDEVGFDAVHESAENVAGALRRTARIAIVMRMTMTGRREETLWRRLRCREALSAR